MKRFFVSTETFGASFRPRYLSISDKGGGEWKGNENSRIVDERQRLVAASRMYVARREGNVKKRPVKRKRMRKRKDEKRERERKRAETGKRNP